MWPLKLLLSLLNGLLMIERDFFKCLKSTSLSVFALGLCILGYAFNLPVFYNSTLIFTSCLHRVSRWARDMRFKPNQIFRRPPHSLVYEDSVLYLSELCQSFLKPQVSVLNHFSCVRLFATLWTIACQAPLSVGFSRQEYWSGLLFPSPGDLPDPRIKPTCLMSPALAGEFSLLVPPGKPSEIRAVVLSHSVVSDSLRPHGM